MQTAPSNYDARAFQELLNRVRLLEQRAFAPRDKFTLRASDDPAVLKDITVDAANTITAADAT